MLLYHHAAPPIDYPTIRALGKNGARARRQGPAFDIARLVERLHLEDGGAMVAADPEYRPLAGAIHEHAPDIGRARQEIVHDLPRGGVEPRHTSALFLMATTS